MLFTHSAYVLTIRPPSIAELERHLKKGFDIEGRTEAESEANWAMGNGALMVKMDGVSTGRILIDVLDQKWPDDMGSELGKGQLFQAWSGGVFGPLVYPGAMTRAARQAWVWKRDEGKLVPGIASCGKLDFAIHRTLWQNDMLPDCAVIYYHIGCESTAPEGASTRPYSDPKYGYWQGAESLMFYCNGLTLLGRSKVFYDSPRGFCETLADGGTCGEAWAEYFEIESLAEDVSEVGGGIGRKRAYFWSLMGDWTIGM